MSKSMDRAQSAYDNMTPPDYDDPMEGVQFHHIRKNDIAGYCEVDGCGKKAAFRSDRPCVDDGDGGACMHICVSHYFKFRKDGEF